MSKSSSGKDNVHFIINQQDDGYKGNVNYLDINFPFSIHPSSKPGYRLRGVMHILDPSGQYLLQLKGKARRDKISKFSEIEKKSLYKGKRNEKLTITKEFYPKSDSEHEIRNKVINAAEDLVCKHYLQLQEVLLASIKGRDATASQAYTILGDIFLTEVFGRKCAPKTIRKKSSLLKSVCEKITGPMSKTKPTQLKRLADSLAKSKSNAWIRDAFSLSEKFWDYCKGQGILMKDNPFSSYLSTHSFENKQNLSRQANLQLMYTKFTSHQTELLYKNAEDEIGDGRFCSVVISLSCGMMPEYIVELRWKDLIWFDATAILHFHIEHAGSGVSNYDVPLTYTASNLLKKRYDYLKSNKYSESKLSSMPIIYTKSNPSQGLTEKQVKRFLDTVLAKHKILLHMGNDSTYARATFFHGAFESRLSSDCGVERESAEFRYLTGRSLATDVTYDRYCDFRSNTGRCYLMGLVRRMDSSQPCAHIPVDQDNDNVIYVEGKPHKVTELIIRVESTDGKDCELNIISAYGHHCSEYIPEDGEFETL